MKVGAILKACRNRSGLSQEELAHRLHINQSDVSKYENDTIEPRISIFQEWAVNTQTIEVLVSFISGMDGLSIMQNIMDTAGDLVTTVFLGGMF